MLVVGRFDGWKGLDYFDTKFLGTNGLAARDDDIMLIDDSYKLLELL